MKDSENQSITGGFGITEMRSWDMTLLRRYRPRYHAVSRTCTLCALSPCDLGKGRRGACGQDIETFLAREALILAVTGAAAHAAHAGDVVKRLIADCGQDFVLDLGDWIQILMPVTQIVTGTRPQHLEDLLPVLQYVDAQIVRLLAAAHFGGESSTLDLESKTMHAGTMDILAMEVAEVAQVSVHGFPRGGGDTPLVPIGKGDESQQKPLILCIGHHSDVAQRIIDKLDEAGLGGAIEVAGLCCTAHEMIRYAKGGSNSDRCYSARIIGNLRDQLSFVRSGRADVVVVDQQCIRQDLLSETVLTGAFFIATSDLLCGGLPDNTRMDPEDLATDLIHRPNRAVFVSDPDRAAGLSVLLAKQYGRVAAPSNHLVVSMPSNKDSGNDKTGVESGESPDILQSALRCNNCGSCTKHCPLTLPVSEMVSSLGEAIRRAENTPDLHALHVRCLACGRCNTACPQKVPVMEILEASAPADESRGSMKVGRGPIDDYEIKTTGPSIVLGDIPGVVAFLGCPEYQDSRDSVSWMARKLAERGYIVLAAGCVAMDIGMRDGGIYRDFHGRFEAGGVINTGSCVSAANAIGALIKVASIFLHRPLDRNFAEIADYILNRIGAAGIMWGGITPKSFSASAGANRLGIPVVFGPQGYKFRRTLEGSGEENYVLDARSGKKVSASPAPAHLCVVSKTKEEALVQTVRLCIRPNDTTWGRRTKLRHYIELSETLLGKRPHDLADCIRVLDDLPDEYKDDLAKVLRQSNWEPSFIPDPTLLEGLVRHGNKAG